MKQYRRKPIPDKAHPLVRELHRLRHEEALSLDDLAQRSGISRATIWNWNSRTVPKITDLEACYNVLGYTLRPSKKENLRREL